MSRVAALALATLGAIASTGSVHASSTPFGYCTDDITTGWNFYCDPDPEPEEPEAVPEQPTEAASAPPPAPLSYTEQIEAFRREFDETKYRAVLDPTPENLQSYMEAQLAMTRMATTFTDQWQRVLFRTPELDINTRFPMTSTGGAVYQDQLRVAREDAIVEAASTLGFMVIVQDQSICGVCGPQLDVIVRLQARTGIEALIISSDGSFHPQFPDAVVDTGQLRSLGLHDYPKPTIALVEPASGLVEPIGSGLLTEDMILERVYVVTQVPPGERY